jgi:hypothetical protein
MFSIDIYIDIVNLYMFRLFCPDSKRDSSSIHASSPSILMLYTSTLRFYKLQLQGSWGRLKILGNSYNSGYSIVVTYLTTDLLVYNLNRAERTGSLVCNALCSYVKDSAF